MKQSLSSPIPNVPAVKFRRRMGVVLKEWRDDKDLMDEENTNKVDGLLQRQNTKLFKKNLQRLESKQTNSLEKQRSSRNNYDIDEESSMTTSSFSSSSRTTLTETKNYLDMLKRMASKISEGMPPSSYFR